MLLVLLTLTRGFGQSGLVRRQSGHAGQSGFRRQLNLGDGSLRAGHEPQGS